MADRSDWIEAGWVHVTDGCRMGLDFDEAALDRGLSLLRVSVLDAMKDNPVGLGTQFHLTAFVDRVVFDEPGEAERARQALGAI